VALCQEEQQERGAAMKRIPILLVTAMAALLTLAPSARAAFGVEEFNLAFSDAGGSPIPKNICRKPQHAAAKVVAQNGKPLFLTPTIVNDCGKGKK
jgi:hypothetical protein